MKQSEIEVGRSYTDNKGNVRKVVGAGPEFQSWSHQEDLDCVRFRVTAKKRGPHILNSEHNCTRQAFASWAKSIVE